MNDVLTTRHLIGFLFLFVAGLVVSYKKINGSFKLSKAFYYMLASTLLISVYYISSTHIYKVTSFWSAFMWLRLSSFSSVLLLLIPSIRKQFIETFMNMKKSIKALIISKQFVDFLAFIVLGLAILNGPIALISALGSAAAPIFIFALTVATTTYLPNLIKEEINKNIVFIKLAAILLIIAGIVFMNLGI